MRIHRISSQFIGLVSGTHKCGIQISVLIVRKLFVNANDSLLISTAKLSNWLAERLPVLNFTHAKTNYTGVPDHHNCCFVG